MNPIFEQIAAHRSVRAFADAPLADEVVREAVRAAQMASTSSHVQAYCLLRVRDPARRATLRKLSGDQAQVEESGAFFVLCGDQRRHALVARDNGVPFVANLETFLLSVIDASLFAQNLVLAFESLGLGCCFIGGLRNRLAEADRLLELPHDILPFYGLCVGEPAEAVERPRRPRLPVEAVLFDDGYPSDEELLAQIGRFDADMAREYEARGLAGRSWTGGIWRKFREARRADLRAFYESKGARLA